MGLSVAAHASRGASPMLTSFPCTSARLTVLLVAVLNISGVSLSAPGSRFSTASTAEASRTILFIPSRLAPFGNQLVDEGHTSLHMLDRKSTRLNSSHLGISYA